MRKEIEKFVITTPSRFSDRDGNNGFCIEKVYVGESIEHKLDDYKLDKVTHSDKDGSVTEWWIKK